MRRVAVIELALCWALWAYPFVFRAKRGKDRKTVAMAPAARWGILLQAIAYFAVFFRPSWAPGRALPAIVASMILAPLGCVLAWTAVRHLGRQWQIRAALYDDHALIETGPYRIVRHPIYASMLAMFLAAGLLITRWTVFLPALAVFIAGVEIRVRVEDRLLAGGFKESFEAYRRRVPAYVPFVR